MTDASGKAGASGDEALAGLPGSQSWGVDPVRPLRQIRDTERLLALIDAVLAIGADLTLPDVLRRIVAGGLAVVGARYGALGVLDESSRGLAEFVHVGLDDETAAAIGHLPEGKGVLGLLIVDPRPIRLDDLSTHPDSFGFPPNHPVMRSFLGVPIEVRGQVFGNLYLTEKLGDVGFGPDDEALAVVLARAAALAIENSHLHGRTRDATLLEDRARIAADLHDRVIQRLFATGLELESLVRLLPTGVAEKVESAVDDLDTTIREIRSTIFALRPPATRGERVRAGLLKLATEAAGALGFEPSLRLEGPVDSAVDPGLAEDLLATAREALTNVVRHAMATKCEVALRVGDGLIELTVTDDGVGPGQSDRIGGRGVGNLTKRAEEHGGGFALTDSPAGRGSRARWWVPLHD